MVSFWNQPDYIGIDAYFPLFEGITTTVAKPISLGKNTFLKWKNYKQKRIRK